jgi:protein O-mannosyl-transferase
MGIEWALTTKHFSNWHPLTWLSHMLDCQLHGLSPGWHHLTNVLLHASVAILLFLVLLRMTGLFWPSAFVAAVFAIHPLRVESVAWISERKDLLSGLFFMLTLWFYVGYVRNPFSLLRYLAVMVFFALGLMAKPMLVTLPFVLLLLDYWPLGRMKPLTVENQPDSGIHRSSRFYILMRLALEKIPLLAMAGASCAVTLWATSEAISYNESLSFISRLENAAIAYVAYLGQLFYPVNLAVLYPYPVDGLPMWKVVGSLLILAVISGAVVALKRRCPYLLMGWLWYLGMLVPVIGLVQVGLQSMADRYTYLPQIGLYMAIAWGAMQITQSWPYRGWACGVAASLAITALIACSCRQTSYWYDSETLWKHTLACTTQNYVAHNNLGFHFTMVGRPKEAMEQYEKSLKIKPDYAEAQINYSLTLIQVKRLTEAIEQLRKVLEYRPKSFEAKWNLGVALAMVDRCPEALEYLPQALRMQPDYTIGYLTLAKVYAQVGQSSEAVITARKGMKIARLHGQADLAGQIEAWLNFYRATVFPNQPNAPAPSKSSITPP